MIAPYLFRIIQTASKQWLCGPIQALKEQAFAQNGKANSLESTQLPKLLPSVGNETPLAYQQLDGCQNQNNSRYLCLKLPGPRIFGNLCQYRV
jgi:hypothetical protein